MTTGILDIHTHKVAPQPQGVVCSRPEDFAPLTSQLYSVGIHPWDTVNDIDEAIWNALEDAAAHPQVAAVGECGIDPHKGGPMFKQMLTFKRQIELSELVGKPLIIHDVKAHDIILGLKRDLMPKQKWLVHGFRGKPTVAQMLTRAGIWLSFGPLFNPNTVKGMSHELMLAETDDSEASIIDVITALSNACGEDLTDILASNSSSFLNLQTI